MPVGHTLQAAGPLGSAPDSSIFPLCKLCSSEQGVYLDFSKAFGSILHIILDTVSFSRKDTVWTFRWIRNWLDGSVRQVIVMSKLKPVKKDIPQGSILGSILFRIFISVTDSGVECTLSEFADHQAELRFEECRLEECTYGAPMRFNKTKYKLLHLG